MGVDEHEGDVDEVEAEQAQCLVHRDLPVPAEGDEAHDGQGVEQRVSAQGTPVYVQNLQHSTVGSLRVQWYMVPLYMVRCYHCIWYNGTWYMV